MAETTNATTGPSDEFRPSHHRRRDSEDSIRSVDNEDAPLLAQEAGLDGNDEESGRRTTASSQASTLLRSVQDRLKRKPGSARRWPSVLALTLLCLLVLFIIIGGFLAPEIAEEYAVQAAVFEPKSLSVSSFSDVGATVKVEGEFTLDGSKVKRKPIRDLGRFGTWLVGEVDSKEATVEVSLPEYGNVILGTAVVPPISVRVRNGVTTFVQFETLVKPGDTNGIKRIASDWLDGKLSQLRVKGTAHVPLKAGIFALGTKTLSQTLVFEGGDLPGIPEFDINGLNFHELETPLGNRGIVADASVKIANKYPVDFHVPPFGFAILLDGCTSVDKKMYIADAATDAFHVQPGKPINMNVKGYVRQLPEPLLRDCPDTKNTPLDSLISGYIAGNGTTIYVAGSDSPSPDTPKWMSDLIFGLTVPLPVPGHKFGHLIKDFSMADVHFSLPDFFAEPGTPDAQPKISAKVKALVALPAEVNFPIDVQRIRTTADVYYKGDKLGFLDIQKWNQAYSEKVPGEDGKHPDLQVNSKIEEAPLTITDSDVFSDVLSALLGGEKNLKMTVKAQVDVEVKTALGTFVVKKIPASGEVPVKPIGGNLGSFSPKVDDLQIVDTSTDSLTLSAAIGFKNPTAYSATIPYADVHILVNDTIIGHATVENIAIKPGHNSDLAIKAFWQPSGVDGIKGRKAGSELLSQYISGYNTSLTLKAHRDSVPAQPALGLALSKLAFTLPTPRLNPPHRPGTPPTDPHDPAPHFITDTTFHLFSSTATFILASPLRHSTLHLTRINATAFYHTDVVGKIIYDGDIAVPPGESETPNLPVEWSLNSVGYDAVWKALGGTLRLKAKAEVEVRIGEYLDELWYEGRGIGTKIRI